MTTFLGRMPTGAQVCDCGHPTSDHRGLPYGSEGYAPLEFHCGVEGCRCVRDLGEHA